MQDSTETDDFGFNTLGVNVYNPLIICYMNYN